MPPTNLVYIDDYNISGTNFYWHKHEVKGLSKFDIVSAGLTSDRVQVQVVMIEPLLAVQAVLQTRGYRLFIKEGYRSKALYEIIYQRRIEKFGKEETDRLLNMKNMPHSLGLSVDVAIWDPAINLEVYLRNASDGTDALFVDFYKDKTDTDSQRYHELQTWLIESMQAQGFCLGIKREYFHFDYRP